MIDELTAIKLTNSIDWMPGYRKDSQDYQDSLVLALRTVARDVDHAKSILKRWSESNQFAPLPANIYDLAEQDALQLAEFNPHEHPCEACGGTSWTVLIGPVPEHLATAPSLGVVRCHCFQAKAVSA